MQTMTKWLAGAFLLWTVGCGSEVELDPAGDAFAESADDLSAPGIGAGSAGFKILLHVGPKVEALAAAQMDDPRLAALRQWVDGYYFLVVNGGYLRHWPGRPKVCELNVRQLEHRGIETVTVEGETVVVADVVRRCQAAYQEYLAATKGELPVSSAVFASMLHRLAVHRTIANLGLIGDATTSAQQNVIAEALLSNTNFAYDAATESLVVDAERGLPPALRDLTDAGVSVRHTMWYQEPTIQGENGSLLSIPGGTSGLSLNATMWQVLANTFAGEPQVAARFLVDVRRWVAARDSVLYSATSSTAAFVDVLFEGGPQAMEDGGTPANFETFIEGTAWLLTHTSRQVYFLMPSHLSRDADGVPDPELSDLIVKTRAYVRALNAGLKRILGPGAGEPVCNPRLSFIPAGYGALVHTPMFPIALPDTGLPAPTVAGQVRALFNLRRSLCDPPPTAPLTRYYNAALAEHWTDTTPVTVAGYRREGSPGRVLTVPVAGTVPLYSCAVARPAPRLDHFLSLRSDCAGQMVLHRAGFVRTGPAPGYRPVYQCRTRSRLDTFLSVDRRCEGEVTSVTEQPLAYVLEP